MRKWQYKVLLQYHEDINAYEVVCLDAAKASAANAATAAGVTWTHALSNSGSNITTQYTVGQYKLFEGSPAVGDKNISYVVLDTPDEVAAYQYPTTYVTTYTAPAALITPTREGYKFVGWQSSVDGSVVTEFPGYGTNPGDVTYTAEWEAEWTAQNRLDYTKNEIDNYFENLGIITNDLELATSNDTYDTTITYASSKSNVLSNFGKFNRPYQEDTITYEVTISYGTNSISTSYEVSVAGFKELTNIASTYIGGNSSTYETLNSNIFTICDIITCGFAFPASNGTFTESSVNGYNFKYYLPNMAEYVIPNAHKNGTYVVLSIAGVDTQYDAAFETICASDSLIDTFVNNIIGLINTYGFDGVDIDWEIPSNGLLFTKLMTKLYAAVKENNENHLVTAAIGGGSWQPQYYDLTNSSKYLDYINLMTYNMSTASGYHHTALYPSNSYDNPTNKAGSTLTSCSISESVAIYNNYGVSNSKIIIGSGFYGIVQTRESTTADLYSSGHTPNPTAWTFALCVLLS